jgi:hypothetical protein
MIVFDVETNGLLDILDKIHVLSWSTDGKEVHHTHDYEEMRKFFSEAKVLIGHNIIRFDIPAVEKVLGIKVKARLIDTLALSWYLNHDRVKHGLEGYGIEYGVPKPVVTDWNSLTPEDYAHRCRSDVKINSRLWRDLDIKLNRLYPEQQDKDRLIDYLTFKMDCAREQESLRWKLDVPMAQKAYDEIMVLKDEKVVQLAEAMPKHILTRVATQPKVMYKKDGELSSHGEKWVELCKEYKQPVTTQSFVVKVGEELGNPNSSDQVKDWLHGLGWVPRTYKFVRDKKTGEERQIEQVRDDGELCESVKELNEVDPAVDLLDGLTVLTHRAGILKSFLECVSPDGYLKAEIAGLTNTLRFKHSKPLVNLPSVDKPYGDVIRGVLTCPEGYVLAGADMTSLEDTTKRHYMKPLDPDYVEEMSREGFDPHLDLAKFAGVITQDDIDKHNSGERSLKALRKNYKVVNYSATYGIGAAKLARGTGMSSKEAKALLDAFWSRNWSVEAVAKSLRVRELFGSMWLYNPVSHFWYALRSDKDRFSTLNQGTGVFCFDTWVALCRKNGIKTIGQFHDEIIALVEDGKQEEVAAIMHGAAAKLNEKVKLNVPLGCDAQFGKTYGEIH